MKTSHTKIVAALDNGAVITCGGMCEMARMYNYGSRVTKIRQGTLSDMAKVGLITRPIECHTEQDGEVYCWLQFFPSFAVEENAENWNEWAA